MTLQRILSFIIILLCCSIAHSQEEASDNIIVRTDTLFVLDSNGDKIFKSVGPGALGHSPHTATMYAAVLPGLGQIYNKKYWKLPLLYGGAAALCYSIHFNGKYYKTYRRAYRDFVTRDPNNKSYVDIVEHKTNLTVEQVETTYSSWFTNVLNNKKNYYRRYRDLSYFGLVGLYVVQIVDAAVDAHFFSFDVSDDLSLEWSPTVVPDINNKTVGATVSLTF